MSGIARLSARWLQVSRAVGRVTFLEILRDKILYNIALCAALLLGLGFLTSRLNFSRPDRIILDFGMTLLGLSGAMIATFMGAGLLAREFDRRTFYVALSRPISRTQFVLGKFLGLAGILTVNWALMTVAYLLLLVQTAGGISALSPTLAAAAGLALVQSWVLGALVILFSTVTTASLSAILVLGLFAIGNNVSELRLVAERMESPVSRALLKGVSLIIPNLEHFRLGFALTYRLPVGAAWLAGSFAYGGMLILASLVISGLLIQAKKV